MSFVYILVSLYFAGWLLETLCCFALSHIRGGGISATQKIKSMFKKTEIKKAAIQARLLRESRAPLSASLMVLKNAVFIV